MSFLRTAGNFLVGRRKIIDKRLSLKETLSILASIPESIKGTASLRTGSYNKRAKITPFWFSRIIKEDFCGLRSPNYIDSRYQVYSGEKSQRRYFELELGKVSIDRLSLKESYSWPHEIASFTYLLKAGGQDGIR